MPEILQPHGPYSYVALVKPKVAIGGIRAYAEPINHFGLVLSVAKEFYSKTPTGLRIKGSTVLVHYAQLDDNESAIDPQIPEIMRAVDMVMKARLEGHDVLVTCAQGRNRSALVAAEALIQSGVSPSSVVKAIKERRANALTNKTFVAWLMRRRR